MMYRAYKITTYLLMVLLGLSLFLYQTLTFGHHWHNLADGIEYQDIGGNILTPWSHIHVFRIDLKRYQLKITPAKAIKKNVTSVNEFANHEQALISINGGFFDKNYTPLGLRISSNKQTSPIKPISWWGIFYIIKDIPHIVSYSQFHHISSTNFAIQAGPRLLINRHIPKLKNGAAQRTALGIDNKQHLIILVTDNYPLSTTQLAELFKSQPLNCIDAINLDGGSSTQLNADFQNFHLFVHGFANVADGIVVIPKP